jgi:hypothetical protein
MALLEDFQELFAGNPDAYGTESGGCIRSAPPFDRHLDGSEPIGVYPVFLGRCRWGVVDLDVKSPSKPSGDYESPAEAHVAALNLVKALHALDIVCWIERTRSDGRHVWVFATEAISVVVMRRALLMACLLAKIKPTEVNPKSEVLAEGQLGNYVRLPYAGERAYFDDRRRVYQTSEQFYDVEDFVATALWARTLPSTLAKAASLLPAPPQRPSHGRKTFQATAEPAELSEALEERLRGLSRKIWAEGRLEGMDRSGCLFKLALDLAKRSWDEEDAIAVMWATDAKWFQKATTRADPGAYYLTTFEHAQDARV